MHSNNPITVPAAGVEYVPYFYEAGLHQLSPLPSRRTHRQPYESSTRSHDFGEVDATLDTTDRTQTIEQVIAQGYFAIPAGDPVTAAISDKMHTSRLGLDDVISQVRQRYEIHDRNLCEIELGKCAAMNAIYQHEAYNGPPSSKQMYAKHKAIQDLYEEERTERTVLWKDISRLKMQIPETAQEYLGAHRKGSILAQEPGDGP